MVRGWECFHAIWWLVTDHLFHDAVHVTGHVCMLLLCCRCGDVCTFLHFVFRATLHDFADLLIAHGVVNAINMDGGGSNTLIMDGVLVNYPSDHW